MTASMRFGWPVSGALNPSKSKKPHRKPAIDVQPSEVRANRDTSSRDRIGTRTG